MPQPPTPSFLPPIEAPASVEAFSALASETLMLWRSGWEAWARYGARLALSPGPAEAMAATEAFMVDSLDLCQRAAAARLQTPTACPPLLNDA